MKNRLAMALPYVCVVLVLVAMVYGNRRHSVVETPVAPVAMEGAPTATRGAHLDVVCHMTVGTTIEARLGSRSYYFCANRCRELFMEDPASFLGEVCMVCRSAGTLTPVRAGQPASSWQGKTYRFCTDEHRAEFSADPSDYFMHTMWGIPGWLYYATIAALLIISFVVFEWRALLEGRVHTQPGTTPATGPRFDIMRFRWIHRALKSAKLRFAARLGLVLTFLLIIAAGLFGNQLPAKNIAPLLTWTIWWGGLIWLIAYLGKAWCNVCPWDAIAEWSESLKLWGRRRAGLSLGLKWPRSMRNIWPATLLFVGLTWIELGFGVTMKPRATAWLGLAILGLAFASIFIFDRKSFCRYGCLVGRVSGLYALFSPLELRARSAEVCRQCTTHSCYTGNEDGDGCPTFEYPATMDQNTYCILCMECVRTCESDNIAVNLRPWAADLEHHQRPRQDEAYLALIMLALTGFHGLTMTGAWRQLTAWISQVTGTGETLAFSIGMLATTVAPVTLYALLVALSRLVARGTRISYREYFIRYAYALLPIALFYHLAHNSEHLLMEGQKLVALASDPFGWEWNIFGTAHWNLEPLVDLPTLWILQVGFVAIGHVFSLWTARRTAAALFPSSRAAFASQVPMLVAMVLFSVMSLWLLKQPMEMRTSAM